IKTRDLSTGIAELAEAVAWFKDSGLQYTHAVFGLLLADGYLRRGEHANACQRVQEILTTSRERGYRHVEGSAERMLAESFIPEDAVAAEKHFEAAVQICDAIGARNELAKAWTGQARLRQAAGDLEGARALF